MNTIFKITTMLFILILFSGCSTQAEREAYQEKILSMQLDNAKMVRNMLINRYKITGGTRTLSFIIDAPDIYKIYTILFITKRLGGEVISKNYKSYGLTPSYKLKIKRHLGKYKPGQFQNIPIINFLDSIITPVKERRKIFYSNIEIIDMKSNDKVLFRSSGKMIVNPNISSYEQSMLDFVYSLLYAFRKV